MKQCRVFFTSQASGQSTPCTLASLVTLASIASACHDFMICFEVKNSLSFWDPPLKSKKKMALAFGKVPPSLAQSPAFSGSFGTRLILVFRWDLDKPLAAVDIPEMQSKYILYCHSCKGPKNSISLFKSTIHALPFSI